MRGTHLRAQLEELRNRAVFQGTACSPETPSAIFQGTAAGQIKQTRTIQHMATFVSSARGFGVHFTVEQGDCAPDTIAHGECLLHRSQSWLAIRNRVADFMAFHSQDCNTTAVPVERVGANQDVQ
jgi:hypothetical protein